MELIAVVHHGGNGAPDRPAGRVADELAEVYDPVYGGKSTRHALDLPHALVVMLTWDAPALGFANWHEDDSGTLATVGLPLLFCPPQSSSRMLTASSLAGFIRQADAAASNDLAHCGGYFAAAHADRDGTLRLATHFIGLVPIYRAAGDGVTVWSNKAAVAAMLAGLEPRLDDEAARQFTLLASPLQNRTLWQGVETEPAATCIRIDDQGVSRRAYADLPGDIFAHRLSPPMSADAVAEQFVAAMGPLVEALRDSHTPSRVHLSGGQDSRVVASLCRRFDYRPVCVTTNTPNEEVPSARRIARHLGMKYQQVEGVAPTLASFMQQAEASAWRSDGLGSLKYLARVSDQSYSHQQGYLSIEGYGGEFGRAYYCPNRQDLDRVLTGDWTPVLFRIIDARRQFWPDPDGFQRTRAAVMDCLSQPVAAGLSPFASACWFYANQRARRWAASRRSCGWGWVIDPLTMPAWVYPAMAAPAQEQIDDRLIQRACRAAWPGTVDVPTPQQLAYQARRRRVASNRIVRNVMKWYDRFRPAPQEPIQLRTLAQFRPALVELIEQAGPIGGQIVTAAQADQWLDDAVWNYGRTELFWHAATTAMWARAMRSGAGKVAPYRTAAQVPAGPGRGRTS